MFFITIHRSSLSFVNTCMPFMILEIINPVFTVYGSGGICVLWMQSSFFFIPHLTRLKIWGTS